jgi:hypothetical protein
VVVEPRRLVILALAFAAACAKKQDMARIEESIRRGFPKQTGAEVLWVDCPKQREAKPGDRFECRVGIENGAITLDLVQDEYANVTWTAREQVVDIRRLESTIQGGLHEHLRVDSTVSCSGRFRPSVPGTRFECEALLARDGKRVAIPVVIKDTKGQVDWSAPRSLVPKGLP